MKKNAEEMRAYHRNYARDNRPKISAYVKKYYRKKRSEELGITVEEYIRNYCVKKKYKTKKGSGGGGPSPRKEREERQEKMLELIEEAKKDPVLRKEPVYNPF
ncbi:MAG: hypothetical protein OXB93_00950 [Cytophagales bacterium]|nr:hypothetical protein [Cytophagales bacterium]